MNDAVIIENRQSKLASIIWLHGLGADGHDFAPIVPELHLPNAAHIRFIFPHAPVMPVTLNGGMPMRSWFDLIDLSLDMEVDTDGIHLANARIWQLIDEEIASGIDSTKIVLAGFSQGGSLTLMSALSYPKPLGGIIGLSCFMPDDPIINTVKDSPNKHTPIFMAHGRQDPVVPYSMGEFTRNKLQSWGYQVEWHAYDMPHSVCPQELADLSAYLQHQGI